MKAVSEQNQVKSNDVVRIQQKRSSRPKIGKVEICLSDIESIVEAIRGGADSIEICCARSDGGITPSIGICEEAVNLTRNTNTVVNVLIRPRDGNFVYSATEFDVIVRDILALRRLGVDGVVVGCLDAAGNVDRTQLSILRAITQGMVLTFHRAFDVCANPTEDLETIIAAGCDRLLTSGGCSSAGSPKGIESLKRICEQARGRIAVVAAAGVSPTNAANIIKEAGVWGVHAGSSVTRLVQRAAGVTGGVGGVSMGTTAASSGDNLNTWPVVDAALVEQLVDNANQAFSHD